MTYTKKWHSRTGNQRQRGSYEEGLQRGYCLEIIRQVWHGIYQVMAFVDDIGLTEQPQKKEGGFVTISACQNQHRLWHFLPSATSATLPVEQTPEYETLIGLNYSHEEATRLLATVKPEPTNIRQFAQTPTAPAKSLSDWAFRVVGESAAKTAVSLVTFPYDAVKSFEPASQKWYRGQYA